jgi:hypothetical protein
VQAFPAALACFSDWVFLPAIEQPPPPGQFAVQPFVRADRCIPGVIIFDPLVGSATNRDFLAIAFGDADGSWESLHIGGGATSGDVRLGRPRRRGDTMHIPIEVEPPHRLRALYLEIEHDAEDLSFVSLHRNGNGREMLASVNSNDPGRLVIAAAAGAAIEEPVPFVLELKVAPSARSLRARIGTADLHRD